MPSETVAIPEEFALTPIGLTFPEHFSEDEWLTVGQLIKDSERAINWATGDWWAYGTDNKYGATKATADRLGWAEQTLKNVATVCRNVSPTNRRTDLSFTHHAEVSHLSEGEQTAVLQEAAERGLSARETRRLARGLPDGGGEQTDSTAVGTPSAGNVSSKWSKDETLEERAIGLVQEAASLLEDAADLLQRSDIRITVNVGQSVVGWVQFIDMYRTEILSSLEAEVGSLISLP